MKWQEKNTKTDPVTQSSKTRDGDVSPVSPAKEIPILHRKHSGNAVAQFLPSSEGMPSGHSIMRRRRSSEGLTDESFTGTRVINFSNRGEHVIHCGKCLGELEFRCFTTIILCSHNYISSGIKHAKRVVRELETNTKLATQCRQWGQGRNCEKLVTFI